MKTSSASVNRRWTKLEQNLAARKLVHRKALWAQICASGEPFTFVAEREQFIVHTNDPVGESIFLYGEYDFQKLALALQLLGREYVETLAQRNLVSMMWCNADPAVAAFGGRDRLFGTNPLAVGIPSNDVPVVIDLATAASAEGKLRVARANGSKIPLGTVIDKDGNESTNPDDFYTGGAILPFGGHKGYCVSLMIELLGGALSGNHPSMNAGYSHGFGTVLIAIDPEKFFGTGFFKDEISEATKAIRSTMPANPERPVLVPGDVENNERKKNKAALQISEAIWNSIKELSA